MLGGRVFVKLVQKVSKLKTNDGQLTQCLKITEKVSFNIASNASYVYILSGQKLIEKSKQGRPPRKSEKGAVRCGWASVASKTTPLSANLSPLLLSHKVTNLATFLDPSLYEVKGHGFGYFFGL